MTNFKKIVISHTLISKIIKLFKVLALKAIEADSNKVVGDGSSSKVDKINKILAKFKNLKKTVKGQKFYKSKRLT